MTAKPSLRLPFVLPLAYLSLAHCNRPHPSEGEELARRYCGACHAFPEPQLLDKRTWETGVLPEMAPRVGAPAKSLSDEVARSPHVRVLTKGASAEEWERIVQYYRAHAPDTLPYQSPPAQPQLDPDFFSTAPFTPRIESSGMITLLGTDPTRERIFVGEAGTNTLRVFDWSRRLVSTLQLDSPPTAILVDGKRLLLLESGILDPNDQPKGRLAQYDYAGADSLRFNTALIDSLFRPVFVQQFDFARDGRADFLICEYGNNRGQLALYAHDGSLYQRQVIDQSPGAIRFEIRDLTGDDAPDIVALFAQGDERIVLFENDGQGRFTGRPRVLARFPPVYGSMHFSMNDFNDDGHLDIVYVNGDNFDYSAVLKPYHGVRILENDGRNHFRERFFFPLYGAARAEVADFDRDGDLDILATSNFADRPRHPERGILFLENTRRYTFRPYAFTIASANQWNVTATADLNRDGWLDVIIGAMDLEKITDLQRRSGPSAPQARKDPILFFENRMRATSSAR